MNVGRICEGSAANLFAAWDLDILQLLQKLADPAHTRTRGYLIWTRCRPATTHSYVRACIFNLYLHYKLSNTARWEMMKRKTQNSHLNKTNR